MAKKMRCPECGGSEFRGLIPIDASATFGIEDLDTDFNFELGEYYEDYTNMSIDSAMQHIDEKESNVTRIFCEDCGTDIER